MGIDWIDVGTASLRCETAGTAGPPLVLVHEMGGSLETWLPAVPRLAATHRVVAYDFRGAGFSEKITGPVTLADHAGDLAALLDALAIRAPAVLAACAVGCGIAATFAASFPERAAGLVLLGPALGVAPEQRADRLRQIAALESGGMRTIVEPALRDGYPQRFRDGREAAFASFRARWLANDPRSFAAIYRMLLDTEIAPVLRAIRCPVLAVGGAHDPLRPPAYVQSVAAMIADSRFVVAPGGHHMPHQIPDVVAGLIEGFSAGLPAERA